MRLFIAEISNGGGRGNGVSERPYRYLCDSVALEAAFRSTARRRYRRRPEGASTGPTARGRRRTRARDALAPKCVRGHLPCPRALYVSTYYDPQSACLLADHCNQCAHSLPHPVSFIPIPSPNLELKRRD